MDSFELPPADPRSALLDLVFAKCTLVYGRDFLSKWEGQNMLEVRQDWDRELGAWLGRPQAIKHALMNLPRERPPNALQFRDLCCSRPEEPLPRLPDDRKPDPARLKPYIARLAQIRASTVERNPLGWAYSLQERERQGYALTETQRSAMREALTKHSDLGVHGSAGGRYTPIPVEHLPPAMRSAEHDGWAP